LSLLLLKVEFFDTAHHPLIANPAACSSYPAVWMNPQ